MSSSQFSNRATLDHAKTFSCPSGKETAREIRPSQLTPFKKTNSTNQATRSNASPLVVWISEIVQRQPRVVCGRHLTTTSKSTHSGFRRTLRTRSQALALSHLIRGACVPCTCGCACVLVVSVGCGCVDGSSLGGCAVFPPLGGDFPWGGGLPSPPLPSLSRVVTIISGPPLH